MPAMPTMNLNLLCEPFVLGAGCWQVAPINTNKAGIPPTAWKICSFLQKWEDGNWDQRFGNWLVLSMKQILLADSDSQSWILSVFG